MGMNLFSWPPGLLTSQDPEPYPAHSGDDENLVIWVPFSHKGCPYHGKVNLKSALGFRGGLEGQTFRVGVVTRTGT